MSVFSALTAATWPFDNYWYWNGPDNVTAASSNGFPLVLQAMEDQCERQSWVKILECLSKFNTYDHDEHLRYLKSAVEEQKSSSGKSSYCETFGAKMVSCTPKCVLSHDGDFFKNIPDINRMVHPQYFSMYGAPQLKWPSLRPDLFFRLPDVFFELLNETITSKSGSARLHFDQWMHLKLHKICKIFAKKRFSPSCGGTNPLSQLFC